MEDLTTASDAAVVLAVARWDEAALAEAYRRHAGACFALAKRVTGQTSQAEEVVQEVFLRLWHQPERFDPERGSLRSFLLAQTHSRSVDLLRSETARRRREEHQARSTATASYDIEHEVWDLSIAENVKHALDDLPVPERQAIELAYFGGHTYRQVAQLLDQPEGTVKSRIRNGLKRIRTNLVNSGVAEDE
ncbi:MAG TPA: sigma-70 family RNA polymerase sigma factor [Acidimicrobiales bacterium]|nr:sigma-70 family RNA polymerase sigma factor [Acidimicrobiales bacterium]